METMGVVPPAPDLGMAVEAVFLGDLGRCMGGFPSMHGQRVT